MVSGGQKNCLKIYPLAVFYTQSLAMCLASRLALLSIQIYALGTSQLCHGHMSTSNSLSLSSHGIYSVGCRQPPYRFPLVKSLPQTLCASGLRIVFSCFSSLPSL